MSKTDNPETLPVLAAPDSSKPNWRRASVKLIPYIGGALDELVFGQIDEARWRRLELTLTELGEMMQERGISASKVRTEDFGALLEIVSPATSRASDKDKRRLLRDLLLNAVDLPPSDPKWESVRLAAGLLSVLEPPALAILAALAHVGARGSTTANLTRIGDTGQIELQGQSENSIALHYHWFVLEQAYRSLTTNQPRLVIAGAHGRDEYQKIALTDVGDFLLEWSTAKPIGDSDTH